MRRVRVGVQSKRYEVSGGMIDVTLRRRWESGSMLGTDIVGNPRAEVQS
jgi:hypothetical protein